MADYWKKNMFPLDKSGSVYEKADSSDQLEAVTKQRYDGERLGSVKQIYTEKLPLSDEEELSLFDEEEQNRRMAESFGETMTILWAQNVRQGQYMQPVRPFPQKGLGYITKTDAGEIRNDDASKAQIESLLKQQGITHKPTFDNLVFDYLNTPVGIRDVLIQANIPQVQEQLTVRQEQMQAQQQARYIVPSFDVVEKQTSFGEKMGALWTQNVKQGRSTQTVRPFPQKGLGYITKTDAGEIRNDDASKAQIESLLKQQGITHKPTFDNLVFDYLNTPVGIRDVLIQANIPQVQEQLTVRQEQMQAQQQARYIVPSFDVVEKQTSFGDKMAVLWATNIKTSQQIRTVKPNVLKNSVDVNSSATGEIRNDDASRVHIESLLKQQGITHKPTFDNLVFDYLNTPVGIRDVLIQANIPQVQEQLTVRQEQMQAQQQARYIVPSFDVVEKQTSFGDKMAVLWATNIKTSQQIRTVKPNVLKNSVDVNSSATGEIRNDDASRVHIESLLKQQGITHKPTFDNLVFDYLNTPVGIRDVLIQANIPQVQEQLTVRQEQMQAQQQAKYIVPSFDVVEKQTSFGEKMEALWANITKTGEHIQTIRPTKSRDFFEKR